jgi:hypothetical protein
VSQVDIDVYPPIHSGFTQAYLIGPSAGIVTVPLVPFGVDGYYWFSMMADVDWWVLFGLNAAAIPDPNPAAVSPAADVAMRIPTNFELQRKLHQLYGTFKVAAQVDGTLYLHIASHPGGGGY